jgi:hypothetical protein
MLAASLQINSLLKPPAKALCFCLSFPLLKPPHAPALTLQISSLLNDCLHPSHSSYRLDLLTKAYEPLKAQLMQQEPPQTGGFRALLCSSYSEKYAYGWKVDDTLQLIL